MSPKILLFTSWRILKVHQCYHSSQERPADTSSLKCASITLLLFVLKSDTCNIAPLPERYSNTS